MRAISLLRGVVAVTTVCVGCAHTTAAPPTDGPDEEDGLAHIRRENATLRRRVQMLEDRVLRLERDEASPEGVGPDRDLPVVKLSPDRAEKPRSPAPRDVLAEAPQSRSRSLDPLPGSGVPEGAWGGEGGLDPTDEFSTAPAVPAASAGGEERSYRLVGSRLVGLTRTLGPKGPDRPARDDKGGAIVDEYDAAMARYKAGDLTGAEQAFEAFARKHPRHDYADNALYWKGEAAYDQHHYADALAAFTEVVERYGGGNKAPDALLKIGLCYGKLGDRDNARDVLAELVAAYPGARASAIARVRLAESEVAP